MDHQPFRCPHCKATVTIPGALRAPDGSVMSWEGNTSTARTLEGPYRDLPDSPDAREVGDLVAIIDSLLVFGKPGEATSLYRERVPSTWDQAVDRIRGWPGMRRSEKLRLFGWGPKQQAKGKHSEEAHSLRDPRLDGWAMASVRRLEDEAATGLRGGARSTCRMARSLLGSTKLLRFSPAEAGPCDATITMARHRLTSGPAPDPARNGPAPAWRISLSVAGRSSRGANCPSGSRLLEGHDFPAPWRGGCNMHSRSVGE